MATGSGRQRLRFSRSEAPRASHASNEPVNGPLMRQDGETQEATWYCNSRCPKRRNQSVHKLGRWEISRVGPASMPICGSVQIQSFRVSVLLWLHGLISLAPFLAGRFPLNAHTGRHSHEGSLDNVRDEPGPPRLPASPECGAIVWFADTKSPAPPEYPRAVISRTFTFGGVPGAPEQNPLCLCERELSARGLKATWALSSPARRY